MRGESLSRYSTEIMAAALCLNAGLRDPEDYFSADTLTLCEDYHPHTLGLRETMDIAAKFNGGINDTHGMREWPLIQAAFSGFSTINLPGILGNFANKFLLQSYRAAESTLLRICSIGTAPNFREINHYALTSGMTYELVGPGGEIKSVTFGEEVYATSQVSTYAKLFSCSRTVIANDDLGAIADGVSANGRGAAIARNKVGWAEFLNNSTFFTSARNNLIEAGVGLDAQLTVAGLNRAEAAIIKQTDPDGEPLGVTGSILLVPPELMGTAAGLVNSVELRPTPGAEPTGNPHYGRFTVEQSAYLSNSNYEGYSAAAWYLLCDPRQIATMRIYFLNGRQEPTIESAEPDFDQLGIAWRGFHDFGIGKLDYRGGVKSDGQPASEE